MCKDGEETLDHFLTACGVAAGVWNSISSWCCIPHVYAFSVRDLVDIHEHNRSSRLKKIVIQRIIIITEWMLWKARNEMIFSNKMTKVVDIVTNVKALGFLWYNN
ncbi:hypothetical protein Hanom_Chr03g00216121 [Helianthus anomalus]